MSCYNVEFSDNQIIIHGISHFDPDLIFDCGQCFNFDKMDDGGYLGIVGGRVITVKRLKNSDIIISNADRESFEILKEYFSLEYDYENICNDIINSLEGAGCDTVTMKNAMEAGLGIRLLRQEKWQTLCSFIISQNNNIPRIKKIIDTISRRFGRMIQWQGREYYTFPTAEALYNAGVDEIFECKTGFRAKYIYDAAKKVVEGDIDLEKIDLLDYNEAEKYLMEIKGVGPKVAACVLLFGYGKYNAFPVDVWVKKVLSKYYPEGFDHASFGQYRGIAQQYLFYYERYLVSRS